MLPDFLQSSYDRYKTDTNTFATWLLETAHKCGYQPPSLAAAMPTAKPTIKKGKRKGKNDESQASPLHYNATTRDLQKFAEVISSSSVTVPKALLAIVKRAIKLRKAVTSWFLGQGDSAKNKSHTHFITVLEQICDNLEWKTKEPSKPDAQQTPPTAEDGLEDASDESFRNRFAVLTVEEPQESTQNQPSPAEAKKLVKVEVVEEEEDDSADIYLGQLFFKTLCLLQDLDNVREFIRITWTEYRDKKIDLMNAAVVTDSALEVARGLVQEVEADWGQSKHDLQKAIFNLALQRRGTSPAPSVEIGLPYNKKMADVAEWCYLPTFIMLDSFADVIQDGCLPVFKKGHFGTYDPKADRERMTLGEKFNEDKIIFLSILPEFCMVDTFKIQFPTKDAITQGLAEFAKTKKVGLWLSFASQIFLDVHHVMRYSTMGAFDDLRMSGLRIQKIIKGYFKLSQTHPQPKFWVKEGDEFISDIESMIQAWIIKDLFQEIRLHSKVDRVGSPPERHALFLNHPILCGLFLFILNMRMQYVSQQLVSQWYDVQQLAFLQNLILSYPGQTKLQWPDMDAFIKIHGESHIFVGNRPKNARESLNRLELASGISSAAKFARDSRSKKVHTPDGKSTRILKSTAAVANLFFAKYGEGPGADGGWINIDRILNELSQNVNLDIPTTEVQKSDLELVITRKWSTTHDIGTLQLLGFIKTRLFEEEPVILYNYFGMHQRSMELLRLIRDKEHHKFVQYFTSAYLPDESLISNIVILIHHVAIGSAGNARALGLASRGDHIVSRIVSSAGDIMREYLKKNGDVACKELRVFCKNKKPIQDEAANDDGKSDELPYSSIYLEEVLSPKAMASLMTGIPIA